MSRGGVLRLFDRIVRIRLGQVCPIESLNRKGVSYLAPSGLSFLVSRGQPVVDSGMCEIKLVQYGNAGILRWAQEEQKPAKEQKSEISIGMNTDRKSRA